MAVSEAVQKSLQTVKKFFDKVQKESGISIASRQFNDNGRYNILFEDDPSREQRQAFSQSLTDVFEAQNVHRTPNGMRITGFKNIRELANAIDLHDTSFEMDMIPPK